MQLYITDKTGNKFWNTSVSAEWSQGERNNLNRHLQAIKNGNRNYAFVDAATATIVEVVEETDECQMTDDELLAALLEACDAEG
jgi:hypothetical protein